MFHCLTHNLMSWICSVTHAIILQVAIHRPKTHRPASHIPLYPTLLIKINSTLSIYIHGNITSDMVVY